MAFLVALVVVALRAAMVQAGSEIPSGWTLSAIALFLVAEGVGAGVVLAVERTAGRDALE